MSEREKNLSHSINQHTNERAHRDTIHHCEPTGICAREFNKHLEFYTLRVGWAFGARGPGEEEADLSSRK